MLKIVKLQVQRDIGKAQALVKTFKNVDEYAKAVIEIVKVQAQHKA